MGTSIGIERRNQPQLASQTGLSPKRKNSRPDPSIIDRGSNGRRKNPDAEDQVDGGGARRITLDRPDVLAAWRPEALSGVGWDPRTPFAVSDASVPGFPEQRDQLGDVDMANRIRTHRNEPRGTFSLETIRERLS